MPQEKWLAEKMPREKTVIAIIAVDEEVMYDAPYIDVHCSVLLYCVLL